MLKLSDFDYHLPPELIAQYPVDHRGRSRLMFVDRTADTISVGSFKDFPHNLEKGDVLVLNDTKVFPCRIFAKKESTGADIEILLLEEREKGVWEALIRPGRRVKVGTVLVISGGRQADTAEVIASRGASKTLRFSIEDVRRLCWRVGKMPLPPYIKRGPDPEDVQRYQTVFAKSEGAIAAPTAGLHFTSEMLQDIRDKGVSLEFVTLHTGLGTFQPLEHDEVEKNKLHPERYRLSTKAARRLNEVKRRGQKTFVAGTTTLRLLETVMNERGEYEAGEGVSEVFIYPGHAFRSADALLTNFHLPRSSLLLLVCAFGGKDLVMHAYETAVKEKFQFYSYGDAMLIL